MDSVPVNISLLSTVTKLVVKDKDDSSDDIEDSVDAAAVLEGKYLCFNAYFSVALTTNHVHT
jgi:hypothetical protein